METASRARRVFAALVMLFGLIGWQWGHAEDKDMVTVDVHELYNVAFDACMYAALKESLAALANGTIEILATEEELQQQVTPCVIDTLTEMGIKSLPL